MRNVADFFWDGSSRHNQAGGGAPLAPGGLETDPGLAVPIWFGAGSFRSRSLLEQASPRANMSAIMMKDLIEHQQPEKRVTGLGQTS